MSIAGSMRFISWSLQFLKTVYQLYPMFQNHKQTGLVDRGYFTRFDQASLLMESQMMFGQRATFLTGS